MKKIVLIILLGLVLSCTKDEPLLVGGTKEASLYRYDFPQGNNEWDKKIEKIFEEYQTQVIYKDFGPNDFNRIWNGTSRIGGTALTDEQAKKHLGFVLGQIFGCINPKVAKTSLPIYLFVAYNLRDTVSNTAYPERYNGIDNWALCLQGDKITYPATAKDSLTMRGKVLKNIYDKSVLNGSVEVPEFFYSDFDYKTNVLSLPAESALNDYYLNRGFVGTLNAAFTSFSPLTNIVSVNPNINLRSYIHFCMRYVNDSEELEKAFPRAKCSKIYKYRSLVLDYMKSKYDIDLQDIAKGPAPLIFN